MPVIEYAKELPEDLDLIAVPVTTEQGDRRVDALGPPATALTARVSPKRPTSWPWCPDPTASLWWRWVSVP